MRTVITLMVIVCILVVADLVRSGRTATRQDAIRAASVRELSDYIGRAQRQRNEALRAVNALLSGGGPRPDAIQEYRSLHARVDELSAQIDDAIARGCGVSQEFCSWPH